MRPVSPAIWIVSADQAVSAECVRELTVIGARYEVHSARSLEQLRRGTVRATPAVLFLDESAVTARRGGELVEAVVARLTEIAPVVVAAAPERQAGLSFLITSGAVDFVTRSGSFVPIAAVLIDRRVRLAERAQGMIRFPVCEPGADFGEILRHEVNNPLTGILGNTELLLARRDRLPPAAVERLQTIAELAIRLRETVRRLSNDWDAHEGHARKDHVVSEHQSGP